MRNMRGFTFPLAFVNFSALVQACLYDLTSTGETQESMNNVSCRRDMTEILLKAA